jgi:glutamate mutase epsilon subunit
MCALDTQEVLSEDKETREETDNAKLVPVSESIRYHRRAQSAERRAEELTGELAEARAETGRLAEELKATHKEQELMSKLAAEGTRDLEAAVLIAKARLSREDKADVAGVVEQMKKEKGYLFGEKSTTEIAVRTSPAKESRQGGAAGLERAAKRAAGTGSRADLQEYMRKRRSVV